MVVEEEEENGEKSGAKENGGNAKAASCFRRGMSQFSLSEKDGETRGVQPRDCCNVTSVRFCERERSHANARRIYIRFLAECIRSGDHGQIERSPCDSKRMHEDLHQPPLMMRGCGIRAESKSSPLPGKVRVGIADHGKFGSTVVRAVNACR